MRFRPWLSRRAFVAAAGLAGALGTVAAGRRLFLGTDGPEVSPGGSEAPLPQVPRRTLGRTGKAIPILGLGGGGHHRPSGEPKYREALLFGANYIDTADCYPGCEEAVGGFLAETGRREDVWITTKSCPSQPDELLASLERSLHRMGTDYVDMLLLHALDDVRAFSDGGIRDLVLRLKAEGRIRHFGFSTHGAGTPDLLLAAARTPWVDAALLRYNFRVVGAQRLDEALDVAHGAGLGLLAMKVQGSALDPHADSRPFEGAGQWSRYQAALKATWEDPRISCALSLMDSTRKLRQNLAAALDTAPLAEADRQELLRHADDTRSFSCDGCDHLCGAALERPIAVGAMMRHLMYLQIYGQADEARRRYAELPPELRSLEGLDLDAASDLCPNGVDIAYHLRRAQALLG